jgi:hypothetical protein
MPVQPANLWWHVKVLIRPQLTQVRGHRSDPVQIIATLPLPVCGYTRSGRDRCFTLLADYGHCAAKQWDYYGFKLGLRIARSGRITHYPWLPARPHDIRLLDELVEGFTGLGPADKGCIDAYRHVVLAERQGGGIVTPPRKGLGTTHAARLLTLSVLDCAKASKQWARI